MKTRAGILPRAATGLGILSWVACALLWVACAGTKKPDKITGELLSQPKEVLFEKGKALIAKGKQEDGRKYLNHVFETYPNETMGREALLLVADSYLKRKSARNYTEARYRYRDYLNRYPGAPRRDYARYQFALCYDMEHEKPDRDQTATREAIEQYRNLIREFPDSGYAGAGRERIRQLTDLLAEHDFGVGYFYLRKGAIASALSRFTVLEERYPDYGGRDKLYYYEARALVRLGRKEEADRYLAKLQAEFPKSDFVRKVRPKIQAKEGQKPAEATVTVDTKPQSQ